jgi:UDP-N-acetyl-D-glucosamine dehydrogenase
MVSYHLAFDAQHRGRKTGGPMSAVPPASSLEQKIRGKSAVVGVVGLGYVGLPLVAGFARGGFPVLGFDVDPGKVVALEANRSYIAHFPSAALEEIHRAGRFTATGDFRRLREADAIIVCVPTPLTPHREPDLSHIESTATQIAAAARPGQLVVLESTTYPGTTEEILKPALEGAGLALDRDVYLAYSPEREDPNNPNFTLQTIPKIVGGVTPRSGELAALLYGSVVDRVVLVANARVAEAAKLVENIFRSVNIALVNELKVCFDRMGIDVWEVLDAAATKPFGFMKFEPGPGLGGHCIPIDPFYLTWKAREYGVATRFIELAGEVNTAMPEWVIQKLSDALNERKRSLHGSRILILGIAYKKNVDDVRESPALEIIERLLARGAEVSYHDPHVPRIPPMRKHRIELSSVALTDQALAQCDAVLIVTDHDAVDYERIGRLAPLIVDTRNALGRRKIAGQFIRA